MVALTSDLKAVVGQRQHMAATRLPPPQLSMSMPSISPASSKCTEAT